MGNTTLPFTFLRQQPFVKFLFWACSEPLGKQPVWEELLRHPKCALRSELHLEDIITLGG